MRQKSWLPSASCKLFRPLLLDLLALAFYSCTHWWNILPACQNDCFHVAGSLQCDLRVEHSITSQWWRRSFSYITIQLSFFNAVNILATASLCSLGHIFALEAMGNGGSNAIIITTAVFFVFSLVTVCLRCFVRLKVVKAFGSDDALMVAAAAFNTAFAICGIVGSIYGMGKTTEFLSHRPDDIRRGLLVGGCNRHPLMFRACWLLWLIVLVARTNLLRIYLHHCKTIYCHQPSSSYGWAHPFVDSLQYYGAFDGGGNRFSFLHNLPMSASRLLLESIINGRAMSWDKHSSWHRLYV